MPDRPTLTACGVLLRRDLRLAFRNRAELANPLLFFVVVISLFPLGLGPDPKTLAGVAPGTLWVTALLAVLLSLDALFRADYEDGTLEQWLVSPQPLPLLVLVRVAGHWLVTGLPLVLLAPVLGVALHLEGAAIATLAASLLLGTPVLSLVGSIAVALIVGLRRGGMLLSLLVLPLYVPVLIFGAGAVEAAAAGLPAAGQLLFLAALLVLSLTLAPLAAAAALRIGIE